MKERTQYQAECARCGAGYGHEWFSDRFEAQAVVTSTGDWKITAAGEVLCPKCQRPDPLALPEPHDWWRPSSVICPADQRIAMGVPVMEAALRNILKLWRSRADVNDFEVEAMLHKALATGAIRP